MILNLVFKISSISHWAIVGLDPSILLAAIFLNCDATSDANITSLCDVKKFFKDMFNFCLCSCKCVIRMIFMFTQWDGLGST